jgi:hypothetical protein
MANLSGVVSNLQGDVSDLQNQINGLQDYSYSSASMRYRRGQSNVPEETLGWILVGGMVGLLM